MLQPWKPNVIPLLIDVATVETLADTISVHWIYPRSSAGKGYVAHQGNGPYISGCWFYIVGMTQPL